MRLAVTCELSLGDSNTSSTLLLAVCFHKPQQNLILLSTFLPLSCLIEVGQQMQKFSGRKDPMAALIKQPASLGNDVIFDLDQPSSCC